MPISDCEVRDPRIRRTRQLLQGALRTLMGSKNFDQITVQDITEAATVNRATFYDHYTDKYALLEALVAGGFHELLHERNATFDGTCPTALGVIILAACDYLNQAHASGVCDHQSSFRPLMDAAMAHAIQRVLLPGLADRPAVPLPPSIVATAASWAICGAVTEWHSTPGRPPAEAIVGQLVELVLPMLKSASDDTTPCDNMVGGVDAIQA